MQEKRKRNWVFVVYPESAPENWREQLRALLVPGYISPLHSDDINADGSKKKPHWHVLLTFKGLKSFEQVKEITDSLHAPGPQPCKDIRAYARYLCHLDNPEKAQYQPAEVESLGGNDYLETIKSAADTDTALSEMMDWCIENRCTSFFKLANYARRERSDWFRVLSSQRTVFLTAWLKSFEWELSRPSVVRDSKITTEIPTNTTEMPTNTTEMPTIPTEKRCKKCGSVHVRKRGKTSAGSQIFECLDCGKRSVL